MINQENNHSRESLQKWKHSFLCILAIATLSFTLTEKPVVHAQESTASQPEVFNGEPASPEQAAFSVRVYTRRNQRLSGIILSDRVISTSYHGVETDNIEYDPSEIRVEVAGDDNQLPYRVKEIRKIGTSLPANDRVLLLLDRPIQFNEFVQPIKLGDFHMRTEELFVIGHGTSEDGNYTKYPRVGKQTLYNDSSTCRSPNIIVTKNLDDEFGAVAYDRDSGGGLIAEIPEGHSLYEPGFYLIGTTHSKCENPEFEDGKIKTYAVAFQSMTEQVIKEEVAKAIEDSSVWPMPPQLWLPSIRNNLKPKSANTINLPYVSNEDFRLPIYQN